MSTPFTIYRSEPGTDGRHEILRSGQCPEKLLGKQVRAGESIWIGEALCDVQNFIVHDEVGRKLVCRHTAEEIIQRAPPGWTPPIKAEVAGLAAKGINPALAARLVQRRQDEAAVALQDGLNRPLRGP